MLAYLLLALANRDTGAGIWALWGSAALAWLGLLAAVPAAASRPAAAIIWTAAFHLAGIWGGPVLEDDYHRYLWDGYRFAQDGTPYGSAPADFFADPSVPPVLLGHLDQINYPQLPTIYGPLTETLFLAAHAIAPGALWPLQGLLSAAALGVMALLARAGAPTSALLLFGWNPLLVLHTSFNAHPDVLAAGLALSAWLALRNGHPGLAGAALACACASRVGFLLLAPLFLARGGARGWLAFVVVLALLYLPFLARGGAEGSVLLTFVQQWQFNAGVFALAAGALGDSAARLLVPGLVLTALAAMVWHARRAPPSTLRIPTLSVIALALPLLLGPVFNAWYWIWLLPMAAVSGLRYAPWIGSAAALLSYGTCFNLGLASFEDYRQPAWLLALEHALIWSAFLWEWLKRGRAAPSSERSDIAVGAAERSK